MAPVGASAQVAVVCVSIWSDSDARSWARILVARAGEPATEHWRGEQPTLDQLCERLRSVLAKVG